MRDSLVFYLNGRRCAVSGDDAFRPLAEFLREGQRLTGTKIGCGEGDCGACSVMIGRVSGDGDGDELRYHSATSCIASVFQVDGSHVVTVEGLAEGRSPGPAQQAMVDHHGSQCGFCTPGILAALTEVFEADSPIDEARLRTGLAGNLCRCTGYRDILDAGLAVDSTTYKTLAQRYPDRVMVEELKQSSKEPLHIESMGRIFSRPARLDDALAFKAEHPDAVIISGATELGVMRNKRGIDPRTLLSLAGVPGLDEVTREGDVVSVGALVTWAKLDEIARRELPPLLELTHRFASSQVRNVATLVGNIAHRSPVADSASYLAVMGAELEVASRSGTRRIDVSEHFQKPLLNGDEIITRVLIPLPGRGEIVRLYKISKRKEMDTSTFRAGIRIAMQGGAIVRASLAFSGVGPAVRRLPETEAFLVGKAFAESTFREAGRRARLEVEKGFPSSRRANDARPILAENILIKFFLDEASHGREEAGVAG
jgi:xanthine dehydrogenase small subunit